MLIKIFFWKNKNCTCIQYKLYPLLILMHRIIRSLGYWTRSILSVSSWAVLFCIVIKVVFASIDIYLCNYTILFCTSRITNAYSIKRDGYTSDPNTKERADEVVPIIARFLRTCSANQIRLEQEKCMNVHYFRFTMIRIWKMLSLIWWWNLNLQL